MTVFIATLSQTAFLFSFIIIGYILARWKFVPNNAQTVLSKLENCVFIPALVLNTFMSNFSLQKIGAASELLLQSIVLAAFSIALSLICVRFCSKDRYERKIYTYGLCFSNFGFMGNAVVSALFPDVLMEYLIFTLPLWTLIYLWGVPTLLIDDGGRQGVKQRMKNFVNPMFICTLLGMLTGLLGVPIPGFVSATVTAAGNCMSPIAMLLTGMTIAQFHLKEVLRIKGVYLVSGLRLIVFPLLLLGAMLVIPLPETFAICAICSLAMPLGLNTIIVPSALGKDTKVASGMALVSHVLSCLTIPAVLALFERICAM